MKPLLHRIKRQLGSVVHSDRFIRILDVVLSPFTLAAAALLAFLRRLPLASLPTTRRVFTKVGVFPVRDHYYEPSFLERQGGEHRDLPGLELRVDDQLALLDSFSFQDELRAFPTEGAAQHRGAFYYSNGMFESGDAECLYSLIRHFSPSMVMEIGSGHSTLMAHAALTKNLSQGAPPAVHICVEPYSAPWLEEIPDTKIIRERVETLDPARFDELSNNDILFIDSSHMIRPNGDVLFEYLQVLPRLRPGVIVHVHDIFTPYDYPRKWRELGGRMWNEQYLLEALLSDSDRYRVLLGLNLLAQDHPQALKRAFPVYASHGEGRSLGSFWFQVAPAT